MIPAKAPIIVIAGTDSLNKKSALNIFLSVNKAPMKSKINIIMPSKMPPKRYFCPFAFESKKAEIKADKKREKRNNRRKKFNR